MILAGYMLPAVLFPVATATAVLVKTAFVMSDLYVAAQDTYQEMSGLLYKEEVETLV